MGLFMIATLIISVAAIIFGKRLNDKVLFFIGVLMLLCVFTLYNYGFYCGDTKSMCSYSELKAQ